MDRVWLTTRDEPEAAVDYPSGDFTLASRGDALVRLRSAVEAQAGPVLVTGEAGVGKTWLWRRLRAEMPASWRWVGVDLSPANDPAELFRLIGYGLGLSGPDRPDASRLSLADFLQDGAADDNHWALVVDEAQSASAAVLEEIRILANRLGRPDGFAALILVGQTVLARRLATRPLTALAARLAAQVHLKPLDLDEARELVSRLVPGLPWDRSTLERRHRDVAGNPRRLIQWARDVAGLPPCTRRSRPSAGPSPFPNGGPTAPARGPEPTPATDERRVGPPWDMPTVVPAKPPLRVEDGLIEVGWEPSSKPESSAAGAPSVAEPGPEPEPEREAVLAAEETIDDHYTALQAWTEWSRTQGRGLGDGAANADLEPVGSTAQAEGLDQVEGLSTPAPGHPGVWADDQHGFAPYSQLFSRLRHSAAANDR